MGKRARVFDLSVEERELIIAGYLGDFDRWKQQRVSAASNARMLHLWWLQKGPTVFDLEERRFLTALMLERLQPA